MTIATLGKVRIRQCVNKVVVPTREQLEAFPLAELVEYATWQKVELRSRKKADVVNALLNSGRATLCASLGN